MKPIKVKISISIDEPVYRKVKELSELDDRGVSSYINLVLRRHLAQLESKQNEEAPG